VKRRHTVKGIRSGRQRTEKEQDRKTGDKKWLKLGSDRETSRKRRKNTLQVKEKKKNDWETEKRVHDFNQTLRLNSNGGGLAGRRKRIKEEKRDRKK